MQKTKRVVSLLLAVMLVFTCFTCLASVTAYAADDEEPTADTFVVAGTPADIFGTAWDATNEANLMTANEDGTFTKDYTVDKAFDVVQLKAVKNGAEWYGDETGNNVTFAVTGAGTFTVTAAPAEEGYAVSVSGDNVGEVVFEVGTVFAVGNGEGAWLNGAAWDPASASNEMTEVEKDVWEISFENVPDGFSRQIKFAIDGAWTHNFGAPKEDVPEFESGVTFDATYDGGNITFDTDDTCTVTAQLDLREFDFVNKTGAKYTITVTYDEPEPTTEPAGTTEPGTEPVGKDNFVVAGTPADIFGTAWDATNEANLMTANEDGTFTKDYTVDKAFDVVQLKAVKNGAEWYGDETGNNVTFALTGAGTFTVTAAPAEEGYAVSVSGDNVGEVKFEVGTVFAVGNGEGAWLNGAAWDPASASNEMTEVAENVWEISFENVPDGFERQIKFAIDGAWTHNFGAPKEDVPEFESGVTFDATYDGGNITFDTDDTCTVTAQLDLREFDFVNKTGAKYTITVKYDTFVVAGTPADIFGTAWDATNEDNKMTANDDGTYTKEYTVDKAFDVVQLKAVKNGSEWYGDETGNNVTFALTGAGTFTVTAAPAEEGYAVSVSGDNVGEVKFEVGTVFAVGNGEGAWLNGAAWDPASASNEMTEVAENVWEISFENVPDGFERQIKFAVDGTWTHNFGAPKEDVPEFESGVTFDATYDGGNITFDTDDTCTVTAQLDLREFDFVNKTGAKYTITVKYDTFVVAGTPADIFGTAWDGTNEVNAMTKNDDGTYTKEYTVDKAFDVVQLKAVKNGSEWYGDETGNNVTFALTGAGTFTVTAAPAEEGYAVSVSGDNVGEVKFEVGTVFAVGNGEGAWLNGMAWSPDAAANEMTEVADDVWEISFENVPDGFERQIKFAVDGTWTHNFGAPKEDVPEFESGVTFDATYDGGNITFDTDDTCTVTAQLDLREFDFVNKTGAKYTITVDYGE